MPTRDCCPRYHAMVRLNSSNDFRKCNTVANLPLCWKFVEVQPCKAYSFCSTSFGLYSKGIYIIALFSIRKNSNDFLKLDDAAQDVYNQIYEKGASDNMLTHLGQELMQAIWLLLLNDAFTDSYINGIVLKFLDGIVRQLYPQILTYAADYPEKFVF